MTTNIQIGQNSIRKAGSFLNENRAKKILLVTGKSSYSLCGAQIALGPIIESCETSHFTDFSAPPQFSETMRGVEQYLDFKPDVIIAVGGGSPLDVAKSIRLLGSNRGLWDDLSNMESKILKRGVPLLAVPTTAGSGAECTRFTVLYNGKNKLGLTHDLLLPDMVIIDPDFSKDLSPRLTAVTGSDALCQAVESFWSINSTEESRKLSETAIRIIMENLPGAVGEGSSDFRVNMCRSANLAGQAINITLTTASHAVSYPFTSWFGISHGHATALTLSSFLEFNYRSCEGALNDSRGGEFVKQNLDDLISILGCGNITEACKKLDDLFLDIGLELRLSELGLKGEKDINIILENVNPGRMSNNPCVVRREDLAEILKKIF